METSVPFDFSEIYRHDEPEESESPPFEVTRTDAEAWLETQGLSEMECRILLHATFDRQSLRGIAGSVGLGKTTVAKIQRSSAFQRAKRNLGTAIKHRVPLQRLTSGLSGASPQEGKSLVEIREWALREMSPDSEEYLETTLREWQTERRASPWAKTREMAVIISSEAFPMDYSHYRPTPADLFRVLRSAPRLLLHPTSKPILEMLVELLEAAHFGKSGSMFKPGGSRETLRIMASSVLREAFRLPRGLPYPFTCMSYGWVVHAYGHRVHQIQERWDKTLGDPITRRLEALRREFPEDLKRFSDRQLRSVATGDVVSVASNLAEEDTGISAKIYVREYLKRFRGFDPFAPPVRAAAPNPRV